VRVEFPKYTFKETSHGPKVWPWWKLFSVSIVKAAVKAPTTAYNVWMYSRWITYTLSVFFDRRPWSAQ
jgi:hypothetical protein